MEIEKSKTASDDQMIEFSDQTGTDIGLWVRENHKQGKGTKQLFFDFETDYVEFSQEDIQALLPYLQNFAETGTLEPLSPLQGETPEDVLEDNEKIKIVANASAKRVLEIIEMQKERIKALEQLAKDWRYFFEMIEELIGDAYGESGEKIVERTEQLLGEE